MPRPQTVQPERILECAANLFEQHGYEGVTTQAVARAAGISEGALFHYFGSKERLFTAALMVRAGAPEYFEVLRALMEAPAEELPPLGEALERVSRAALDFFRRGVRAIAVLAVRQGHFPPAPELAGHAGLRPGPEAAHRILAGYFERLQRRGELRPGDCMARASALLDGLFGYAFASTMLANPGDARTSSWVPDAERFRRQFLDDFIRGISPSGSAPAAERNV